MGATVFRTVVAPRSSELNRLRRRLRALPHAVLLQTLQDEIERFEAAAVCADNSGRFVAANTAATTLSGYSRTEILRLSVRDVIRQSRPDAFGQSWQRFIQAGTQTGEYMLMRKDGLPVAVQYSAYASVAPGMHLMLLAPLEIPSSI